MPSFGLPTPEEAAKLAIEQKRKKADLYNYVNQANIIINEINMINGNMEQAGNCISQIKVIPNIINESCAMMGAVGYSLQKGLIINGTPVGINISSDSINIPKTINNEVTLVVTKIQEYCMKKNREGNEKKFQVERIKIQYQNRLASYPFDLGPYGPAPSFPNIPEVLIIVA